MFHGSIVSKSSNSHEDHLKNIRNLDQGTPVLQDFRMSKAMFDEGRRAPLLVAQLTRREDCLQRKFLHNEIYLLAIKHGVLENGPLIDDFSIKTLHSQGDFPASRV